MKVIASIAVSLLFVGFLGGAYSEISESYVDRDLASLNASIQANKENYELITLYKDEIEKSLNESIAEEERLSLLLEIRPAFILAVEDFEKAYKKVPKAVDVKAEVARVHQAQEKVLAAEDKATVETLIKEVNSTLAAVESKVQAHKEEQARLERERKAKARQHSQGKSSSGNSTPRNSTGGGDWFSQARQIMNNVGGSHVTLYRINGTCAGSNIACASGSQVGVGPGFAGLSYSRKVWAMTHELAHTYQFKVWGKIHDSSKYYSLFNGNIEVLANCMASVRGATNHGHRCSSAMLNWASGIWRGQVS